MTETPKPWDDPVHGGEPKYPGHEEWDWKPTREGEPFRTCSYCGSIHPEDLARQIIDHAVPVRWADFKYGWPHKLYLDIPNPNPQALYVLGQSNMKEQPGPAWVRREDVPPGTIISDWSQRYRDDWYLIGPRAMFFAKFYSVHLADERVPVGSRETIMRASGVRFMFNGHGGVSWRHYVQEAN